MKHTVFFSWQSDTATKVGHSLIDRALKQAIGAVGADTEVEEAVRDELELDKDTKGVSGSPPIVDTIFRKIDRAAVFVADLTFAGRRPDGAPIPNPNVLIEYGWALKSLGHNRVISVMNTAYGNPTSDQMPFDLRHLRNPIRFHCALDANDEVRRKERVSLGRSLEVAIKAVLESDEFKAALPLPPAPPRFVATTPLNGPARFRANREPIGITNERPFFQSSCEVRLADGPAIWLRVMPDLDPRRTWSISELQDAATKQNRLLQPINAPVGSYDYVRGPDGFGIRSVWGVNHDETPLLVFAFKTGELWTIDTFAVSATQESCCVPLEEVAFVSSLEQYADFLNRIGIAPPYRWIAGIEGIRGRGVHVGPPYPRGSCVVECVEETGLHDPSVSAKVSLEPFFSSIFEHCGVPRRIIPR